MLAEDFVLAEPVASFGMEQVHELADPPAGVLACRDDQPVSARLPGRLPGDNHVAWSCDFLRVGGLASWHYPELRRGSRHTRHPLAGHLGPPGRLVKLGRWRAWPGAFLATRSVCWARGSVAHGAGRGGSMR